MQVFPAVLRSLKNKSMRQALVDELAVYIQGPQAVLEQQQFDMIVRLMNSSLQVFTLIVEASQVD